MSRIFLVLLLVTGIVSYGFYQQHQRETLLLSELPLLLRTLDNANTEARRTAEATLRRMQETVAKDRNQPHDLAVLATATSLQACANNLLGTLQAHRTAFSTSQPTTFSYLSKASLLSPGRHPQQQLQQELARYAAALRQLATPDSTQLVAPDFGYLPTTLADLAHLESQVLNTEIRAIQRLHQLVGAATISSRVVAVATAESAVVAPGTTYRAQLFLVKSLLPQSMHMFCNGRAIPIGPMGAGLVRFRAPSQPGPAFWIGKIHLTQNGRDTTFQVRVPYQVVRR